jgi:hypothetical protein
MKAGQKEKKDRDSWIASSIGSSLVRQDDFMTTASSERTAPLACSVHRREHREEDNQEQLRYSARHVEVLVSSLSRMMMAGDGAEKSKLYIRSLLL